MNNVIGCNPEVLRDLLDRHTRLAALSDTHDIITELSGVGLGHSNILPGRPQGKPSQMSPIGAADPIDDVIKYQADRGNFAQQPEHLRRPSNDDQAPPPTKRPRSNRNRAPKQ